MYGWDLRGVGMNRTLEYSKAPKGPSILKKIMFDVRVKGSHSIFFFFLIDLSLHILGSLILEFFYFY